MMQLRQDDAAAAVELAAGLLSRAIELQTPQERRQQAELDRMISQPDDKATLVEMTDQAFRTHTPARVADQLVHLLDVQGIPRFFSPVEQAMLRGFQSFGEYLPGVAVPLVKDRMRKETANVILPAEPQLLSEYLSAREQQGVRMNVNLLGEAILGEAEAQRRWEQCIHALRLPEVRCLSVKISTLDSQVSSVARSHTIAKVADRLEQLYRVANQEPDSDSGAGKFVYLDMEEYRDLYLTADVLCETLGREGLARTCAGIALQAYIPDSFTVMQRLIDWSRQRVSAGGMPITIRLVKGANLEMERVESSIGGHQLAPYETKLETDANFKSMLLELVAAAADRAVRVGLASHNLFDVALGMIWAERAELADRIQFEMLEGMANHQRRAISERGADMLLYAPACTREGFLNAIGYLIRRLDENTGPQNFLRHAFRLRPDSQDFELLADGFCQSLKLADSVPHQPRRNIRRREPPQQPPAASHWSEFVNEPDTDWAVPDNAVWADKLIVEWQMKCDAQAIEVPLHIGREVAEPQHDGSLYESTDPSRPGVVVCRFAAATVEQVKQAVSVAADDPTGWRETAVAYRHELLRAAAHKLRQRRDDLIGAMIADGGKTIGEADPEVSEAIDFCEFYPLTVNAWSKHEAITVSPRGVVVVVTPWNFPLAIPCGGVAAALAAGNTVILKPASQTVLPAALLCQSFWDAGVPRQALQLVPCDGSVAEAGLIRNRQVDTVILTGGTATARRMLEVRPDLHLLAETGGKNATIVTAMADRDLAVKHLIHSAFSHSGQKCSATSLLLLENEVFHDPKFKATLRDAVESIPVGSSWQLHNRMGPLIREPGDELARGLKTLEDDETWLVVPEHVVGNPQLYRPGVKWNIRPGGFTHMTELFGPVLGVMPFSRLEEAIAIVQRTGYGLTSGLESLDDREIELWQNSIHAGNLYINRPTTGAIVLRQPFGGVGLSAYGPGVKAGGPHYVLPLMCVRSGRLIAQSSVPAAVEHEFSKSHDTFKIVGQDNLRRYRGVRALTIRVEPGDGYADALTAINAAVGVGCRFTLSIAPEVDEVEKQSLEAMADEHPGLIHTIEESDSDLTQRIRDGDVGRLRLLDKIEPTSPIAIAAAQQFVTIIAEPVVADGRIECLRYLDEQSISHNYHRYGNLGRRAQQFK